MAVLLGAVGYSAVMYRFQTYHERNNMPASTYEIFAGIMFLLGFAVGFFDRAARVRDASFLIAGVFAAHCLVIGLDWQEDPTNHSLLPFEFIYLGVLGCPAYLGTFLSRNVTRRT